MRRVVASALAALGVAGASLVAPAAPALAAGKKMCAITDERLDELSGLVATANGYIAVNDSSEAANRKRVFYLSKQCAVTKNVQYSGGGPRDTEDLAVSPDRKTLWIADIGDNATSAERRTSVALWSMPIGGAQRPTIHRLSYPDGKHDAEALLIGANNIPVIITKTGGKAGLYSPAQALTANNETPVPMKKVGEVTLPKTTTESPLGAVGRLMVTGAASSPDGSKVVLRTYADAFEYDVAGGDVVKALTSGTPRATALDSDAFGEAIAYTADGRAFLTVSDLGTVEEGTENAVYQYTPSQAVAPEVTAGAAGGATNGDSGRSWIDELSLQDITYMIGAVGVLGALLVGAGVFGILRARRRRSGEPVPVKGKGKGGPVAVTPEGAVAPRQPVPPAPVPGYPTTGNGYDDGYWSVGVPAEEYQPAPAPAPARAGVARPAGGGGVYGGGTYRSGGGGGGAPPQPGPAAPSGAGVYGRPQPNVYGGPPQQPNVYGGGQPNQSGYYPDGTQPY
ncbi:hypothetical protein WEI85_09480 [Actinomycetes bacterium KLBMP 9797]